MRTANLIRHGSHLRKKAVKWESANPPDTKQGLDFKTTHVQVLIRPAFELLIALDSNIALDIGLVLCRCP
ncbi:hypothetical protein BJP37_29800 [Moorena bouillonii PNG]|uniref:Uncharacterized protein n=1 Tax=Moorena bouillonii PNG TaxID=568701 RepID=A0A1U7N9I8_9CYAN|nr:hypothetical protein BJP37_29800 [Moorena bouillonii PNG]